MTLQDCTVSLDRDKRELNPHGTLEFPCAGYSSHYTDCPDEDLPWHYHDELEFIEVIRGKMQVQVPGKSFVLNASEGLFINGAVLHCGSGMPSCEIHSFVFSKNLLAGEKDSVIARKYIEPLLRYRCFDGYKLKNVIPWEKEMLQAFSNAFWAFHSEEYGYEVKVREALTEMCLIFCRQFQSELTKSQETVNTDHIRIRQMLDFIHMNYGEKINLSEIAEVAGIGERECLRCFRRIIRMSPIQYLLKYRMTKGAALLLAQPHLNVAEVSIKCGFDSPSNFSKAFKKYFNRSPKEYRKMEILESVSLYEENSR